MTLRDPADLHDLLNYRLIRLAGLGGAPVIRLCEGRYGISRREWRIVALLAAHGPLAPSVVAERAELDRARTSRAITGLVAKRLVERAAQPGDQRRAVVELSEAGERLYGELFPQIAELNRQIMAVLDDAAMKSLDDALRRLTESAASVNQRLVTEVRADRRRGASRRRWPLDE